MSKCGNHGSYLTDVHWDSWGGPEAVGTGRGVYVHDDYSEEPAEAVIVAYDLGDCRGRTVYRKVNWYFPTHGMEFVRDSERHNLIWLCPEETVPDL